MKYTVLDKRIHIYCLIVMLVKKSVKQKPIGS